MRFVVLLSKCAKVMTRIIKKRKELLWKIKQERSIPGENI